MWCCQARIGPIGKEFSTGNKYWHFSGDVRIFIEDGSTGAFIVAGLLSNLAECCANLPPELADVLKLCQEKILESVQAPLSVRYSQAQAAPAYLLRDRLLALEVSKCLHLVNHTRKCFSE